MLIVIPSLRSISLEYRRPLIDFGAARVYAGARSSGCRTAAFSITRLPRGRNSSEFGERAFGTCMQS
jgi:hypothetical protein